MTDTAERTGATALDALGKGGPASPAPHTDAQRLVVQIPPGSVAEPFTPSAGGRVARVLVAAGLVTFVLVLPQLFTLDVEQNYISLAAIYACVALSMNVLTGYLGQLSLGHQAFFGVGAFVSGQLVTSAGLPFGVAVVIAGLVGALACLLLGGIALRVRGLYLAIVTLAYGLLAQNSLFLIRGLTGGGAGVVAPRPELFGTASPRVFAYICLGVLALIYLFDIRLLRSKAGRAILAIRDDERVAASFGINVTGYKLLAFIISGTYAGLAGALFGHWLESVVSAPFDLTLALTFVLMTVVGGLGSRIGVLIGGAFFAVVDPILQVLYDKVINPLSRLVLDRELSEDLNPIIIPAIGAFLLLLTILQYPGGIGQQISPIRNWIVGGRFDIHSLKDSSAYKARGGGVGRP